MGTQVKTFVGIAACIAFVIHPGAAQESSPSALDETLYRSVCERVQTPVVFSTRDTLFALSLPTGEPAEVYLQLTVGKNGKVKEKLTRVNANHIASYVAPAFVAATKDLRIDRSLLSDMQGKDTSLILTFPLEYQCVYDTVSKEWLSAGDKLREGIKLVNTPNYPTMFRRTKTYIPMTVSEIEEAMRLQALLSVDAAESDYRNRVPTAIWYYFAFIKGRQE